MNRLHKNVSEYLGGRLTLLTIVCKFDGVFIWHTTHMIHLALQIHWSTIPTNTITVQRSHIPCHQPASLSHLANKTVSKDQPFYLGCIPHQALPRKTYHTLPLPDLPHKSTTKTTCTITSPFPENEPLQTTKKNPTKSRGNRTHETSKSHHRP